MAETLRSMVIYTVALVACSGVLVPVANLGWVYVVVASITGALFLGGTLLLARRPTEADAMKLFSYSISYITLIFTAIAVDVLVK
jgi:protoheme IX farnesyltransferase